jgi:hypothetical protein
MAPNSTPNLGTIPSDEFALVVRMSSRTSLNRSSYEFEKTRELRDAPVCFESTPFHENKETLLAKEDLTKETENTDPDDGTDVNTKGRWDDLARED